MEARQNHGHLGTAIITLPVGAWPVAALPVVALPIAGVMPAVTMPVTGLPRAGPPVRHAAVGTKMGGKCQESGATFEENVDL